VKCALHFSAIDIKAARLKPGGFFFSSFELTGARGGAPVFAGNGKSTLWDLFIVVIRNAETEHPQKSYDGPAGIACLRQFRTKMFCCNPLSISV
jgi:hypothetical protein